MLQYLTKLVNIFDQNRIFMVVHTRPLLKGRLASILPLNSFYYEISNQKLFLTHYSNAPDSYDFFGIH